MEKHIVPCTSGMATRGVNIPTLYWTCDIARSREEFSRLAKQPSRSLSLSRRFPREKNYCQGKCSMFHRRDKGEKIKLRRVNEFCSTAYTVVRSPS